VASTFTNVFVTLAIASAGASAAWAQLHEVKPIELQSFSDSVYRQQRGPDATRARYFAQAREDARKNAWAEEAEAITRSGQGQNVVRDDDELYIYSDPPRSLGPVVLRTIWGTDPGVFYLYLSFDDIGRFHVVSAGIVDEGHLMLISARTGLVYRINRGLPVYSPDMARFFSTGGGVGMSCLGGLDVFRSEGDKLFREGGLSVDCDQPCTHEWSGPNEVKSICNGPFGKPGKVEYRLTYRDGAWHSTRSEISP
jgi:hypothetical protein